MLLMLLAARRNKIVNSFLMLLIAMICWTGGSFLMRSCFWPNYKVWYHVSILGLFLLPYGYFRFITEFGGKQNRFLSVLYLILYGICFIINVPNGLLLAPPQAAQTRGVCLVPRCKSLKLSHPAVKAQATQQRSRLDQDFSIPDVGLSAARNKSWKQCLLWDYILPLFME